MAKRDASTYPNGIYRVMRKRGLTVLDLEKMTGIQNGAISRAARHNYGLSRKRWAMLAQALEVEEWELRIPVELTEKNLA